MKGFIRTGRRKYQKLILLVKEKMKMFRKKSLLALLLSLCMVVGILPATVFAAGAGMHQYLRWAEIPKSLVKCDAPSGGDQEQDHLLVNLGETSIYCPDLTLQTAPLINYDLTLYAHETTAIILLTHTSSLHV